MNVESLRLVFRHEGVCPIVEDRAVRAFGVVLVVAVLVELCECESLLALVGVDGAVLGVFKAHARSRGQGENYGAN